MDDEGGGVHVGHAGGPGQGELAFAEEGRGQGWPDARRLQETLLVEAHQQRVGVVAVEHHDHVRLCLAQGLRRIVLEAADAHGTHGHRCREGRIGRSYGL